MIYAIFLRGINTGGMKLLNHDFTEILSSSGCSNVQTIQAAGTAVFSRTEPLDTAWKNDLGSHLSQQVGKPVSFIIRTLTELIAALELADALHSPADCHDYIILTDDDGLFDELVRLHANIPFLNDEKLTRGQGCFIWTIRKGETLSEFGNKILGSTKYRQRLTSRNANTIRKTVEMMKQQQTTTGRPGQP